MKRSLLLCAIAIVHVGCEQPEGKFEKEVVCLVDHTDTGLVSLTFEDIKPLLSTENPSGGIRFSVKSIEDNDFGNRINVLLKPGLGADETQGERYMQKAAFYKNAQRAYDSLYYHKGPRSHSVIYRVVVEELKRLSKSPTQAVLVIQSDLLESSDIIDLYANHDLQMLLKNPKAVKRRFEKSAILPNLNNVTVFFVFKPKNLDENQTYRAILSIYRELIEESGGIVNTGF